MRGSASTAYLACVLAFVLAFGPAAPGILGAIQIDGYEFPPVRGLDWSAPSHGMPKEGALAPDARNEARLSIVPAALSWLGTPYAYAGFSSAGIDCSGLAYRVLGTAAGAFGPFPRSSPEYALFGDEVQGEPQPGDILLFSLEGSIYHVGIALSAGRFIHSASEGARTGVIITNLGEGHWRARLSGIRRLPD